MPLLIGTNHNEGRTFAQGFTGLTQQQADDLITKEFGSRAPAILARYPWSSDPSPYSAAYMIGDVWTGSVFLTGIGNCPRYSGGQLMSLRPGDQTRTITGGTFSAEHQCSFWNAG